MWDNTVITNAGVELIKNTMSGETIVITAVKSGTGKVSVDVLAKQTEVVDEKQNGTIQSIKNKGNAITVSVLFENSGLAKGYTMNQIGIYAKTSDQTEILFAISQDNAGKEIPSESSMPYYSLVSNFNFSFSNDLSITSAVEPLGYVTLEDFEEHKNDTDNPHKVTKNQIGLGNVENKSSESIRSDLTIENIETALNYKPVSPTDFEDYKNSLNETLKSVGKIQELGTSLEKKLFFCSSLVKTNSNGKAIAAPLTGNDTIKDWLEKKGGKWDASVSMHILAWATDSGVTLSASANTVKGRDDYGNITIYAYNADGTPHYDSGQYTNTGVRMIIIADVADS